MKIKSVIVSSTLLAFACGALAFAQTTQAAGFNPMNMMNPSKWFGGKSNRYYDDDYYYDRYRYGYGPWGYGRGWGPGYGYGPYGYGPGYGYGYGAPGYGQSAPASPPPVPE